MTRLPLAHGRSLGLEGPLVMGILNATPDSFSDGGAIVDPAARDRRIEEMLAAGADILDVGGESTRPGHTPVPADEELRRVLPVIEAIRAVNEDVPISVDTRKAEVASKALIEGASFVNDVSSLGDPAMAGVVVEQGCAYVAMRSADCHGSILDACADQINELVSRATESGIPGDCLIVDPGLGFGVRPGPHPEDNLALIDSIAAYSMGFPVLIGASRKRFVAAIAEEDLVSASVSVAIRAARAGAAILRVHDVAETVAALGEILDPN